MRGDWWGGSRQVSRGVKGWEGASGLSGQSGQSGRSGPAGRSDGDWPLGNRRDFAAGSFEPKIRSSVNFGIWVENSYGIGGTGAVLVRPDGYVGARWENLDDGSKDEAKAALNEILCAAR